MAWPSTLQLGFNHRTEKTLLTQRQHTGALRVQRALYPETGTNVGICHAILLYPPAGIAGGDTLTIDIYAETNSHAVLTTPGANKWYGMVAKQKGIQNLTITLAEHARVEWLPQETIFYNDSDANACNHIYLDPTASFIGWEINVLGRQAYEEIYATGKISLQSYFWRLSNSDNDTPAKLLFADVLNQSISDKNSDKNMGVSKNGTPSNGSNTWFSSKVGLADKRIFATLWVIPPSEQAPQLKSWAENLACTIKAHHIPIVVTHTEEVLLLRYLGDEVRACFVAFGVIRGELRRLMWGLDNHEPRIWAT